MNLLIPDDGVGRYKEGDMEITEEEASKLYVDL